MVSCRAQGCRNAARFFVPIAHPDRKPMRLLGSRFEWTMRMLVPSAMSANLISTLENGVVSDAPEA